MDKRSFREYFRGAYEKFADLCVRVYTGINGTRERAVTAERENERLRNENAVIGDELLASQATIEAAEQAHEQTRADMSNLEDILIERDVAITDALAENVRLKAKLNEYDPIKVTRLEGKVEEYGRIIALQKSGLAQHRRQISRWKSTARNSIHESCIRRVSESAESKGVVFVLNHLGNIRYQSPKAVRVYGPLMGQPCSVLIYGTKKIKEQTQNHFNQPSDGWLYTETKKGKRPAHVYIVPETFRDESIEEDVRHSTIIKVERIGYIKAWPSLMAGAKCYQDELLGDLEERKKTHQKLFGHLNFVDGTRKLI